jgi:hypothetical protein
MFGTPSWATHGAAAPITASTGMTKARVTPVSPGPQSPAAAAVAP